MKKIQIAVLVASAAVGALTERAFHQETAEACECVPPEVLMRPTEVEGSAAARELWLGRPLKARVGIRWMRFEDEEFNHVEYDRKRPDGGETQ